MGQYSKYKLYYKEEYDGEQWTPVIPYQYYGEMIEEYSTDCGYVPPTRTIVDYDSDCSGTTKVTTATTYYQISYDNGQTWVTTSSTSSVTYEYDSEDCAEPTPGAYDYLTFIARQNYSTFKFSGSSSTNKISYSLDSGLTWSTPSRTVTVGVMNSGDTVMWKGNMEPTSGSIGTFRGIGTFSGSTSSFDVEGNVMSLLYGVNFRNQTSLSGMNYVFSNLFYRSKVINAKKLILPATTLSDSCYVNMFNSCTSLTHAPELPATTLSYECYGGMFNACSSLANVPSILPATTLTDHCYDSMFNGCSSLTITPQLPATTLADYCYYAMFGNCNSLIQAPQLPATTLTDHCYFNMFYNCQSLTRAPQLPATTLTDSCYWGMFTDCILLEYVPDLSATILADSCCREMLSGCISLIAPPQLPATTLAVSCYMNMFKNCTSLEYAPQLPATTLAVSCYNGMFDGCTSFVYAPQLPATTLASYCYSAMFKGCTSLGIAPDLLSTTLVYACYYSMFENCSRLNHIKMLGKYFPDGDNALGLSNWVKGVAANGIFIKSENVILPTGDSGIPNGWTVQEV